MLLLLLLLLLLPTTLLSHKQPSLTSWMPSTTALPSVTFVTRHIRVK
jgi:hypothetical protein